MLLTEGEAWKPHFLLGEFHQCVTRVQIHMWWRGHFNNISGHADCRPSLGICEMNWLGADNQVNQVGVARALCQTGQHVANFHLVIPHSLVIVQYAYFQEIQVGNVIMKVDVAFSTLETSLSNL